MAQGTTSPLYAIIAANDVATAMVDGPSGYALTQEVIEEAVDCRLAFARGYKEFARRGEWFFKPWNADEVLDPSTGRWVAFDEAPRELLTSDPNCWVLHPGETWHGFEGLDDGWCMLDPIKFGVVCPGMGDDGHLQDHGIPAAIVTAYIGRDGIIPSRTTDHMVLFLFSIGVTRGKWGTLINALLDFKRDYDRNAPLAEVVPGVVSADPARYAGKGLKDLSDEMWACMRTNQQGRWMAQAYSALPAPELRPRDAFKKLMAGQAELLPLDRVPNRVSGVGVIPYPPGIPIVMPGENFGPADGPWLSYVRALQEWGQRFPGFEAELEGAEIRDGNYHIYCLK